MRSGVTLASAAETWLQDSDSCESSDIGQSIEVFTEDAGGGAYIVIKTDRWAIDREDVGKFCEALLRVCDRVGDGEGDPYEAELQVFA